MSDKFKLGVGQAHEIEMAMNRVSGWNESLVKVLCTGDNLNFVREVLFGRAEIKPVECLVDLDAAPYIPAGWKVEEHVRGGQFKFDPAKVKPYFSKKQRYGKVIGGYDLRQELKAQPAFNANLLDFLLKNPRLIPESWKGKAVFFWGTIYRDADGNLCVRCLAWNGSQWCWDCHWLGSRWDGGLTAAVLSK